MRGGLTAAVLVGIALIVGMWVNRVRLDVPDELTVRVEYAARAILNNDAARLNAVSVPGSSAEAAELLEGVRGVLEKKGSWDRFDDPGRETDRRQGSLGDP